jgi:hypothetical protein
MIESITGPQLCGNAQGRTGYARATYRVASAKPKSGPGRSCLLRQWEDSGHYSGADISLWGMAGPALTLRTMQERLSFAVRKVCMLSATTPRLGQSRLEAFQLALSLVAAGSQASDELQVYVTNVLRQASALARDPRQSLERLPESIELAYEMLRIDQVKQLVETVAASKALQPDEARRLLEGLEQNDAGQERFGADRIIP